ncbi:MAG: hypothetical protein ABI780_02580, partial [Ardenticatenales bacterium]
MFDDRVHRRWRRFVAQCTVLAAGIAVGATASVAAQAPTEPPPAPPYAEDARSIAAAFRALADVAGAATDDIGWQRADAAYNDVLLAALDAHRPAIAQAGDVARRPLEIVDAALAAVGQALDAQGADR